MVARWGATIVGGGGRDLLQMPPKSPPCARALGLEGAEVEQASPRPPDADGLVPYVNVA
jgi:hypothetical protein